MEKSRSDVMNDIEGLSDFARIDYLERLIKGKMDLITKKFCHQKLAYYYSERKMFGKAAQHMDAIARLGMTYNEKIQFYMEESRLLVEAGNYPEAEKVFDKALSFADNFRRIELKKEFFEIVKDKVSRLERDMKRAGALEALGFLYRLSDDIDKKWIRQKLIDYYKTLGRIKELSRITNKS